MISSWNETVCIIRLSWDVEILYSMHACELKKKTTILLEEQTVKMRITDFERMKHEILLHSSI